MQLTTKGRYALMAMVQLAGSGENSVLSLASIAQEQQLDLRYLQQLFVSLRRSGLVEAVRGPGGGYRLARAGNLISVAEVIDAVDESVKMTRCSEYSKAGCMLGGAQCLTHHFWEGLGEHIRGYLSGHNLEDIVKLAKKPLLVEN